MESSGIYYLLARETDYRIRAKMAEECQVLCERNCLHEHFTPPSIHKNKPTIVRFSRVAIFNPPTPPPQNQTKNLTLNISPNFSVAIYQKHTTGREIFYPM